MSQLALATADLTAAAEKSHWSVALVVTSPKGRVYRIVDPSNPTSIDAIKGLTALIKAIPTSDVALPKVLA